MAAIIAGFIPPPPFDIIAMAIAAAIELLEAMAKGMKGPAIAAAAPAPIPCAASPTPAPTPSAAVPTPDPTPWAAVPTPEPIPSAASATASPAP